MNSIQTYCPTCDIPVNASLLERQETIPVRGESVTIDAHVAVCPHCGADIGDLAVDQHNLETAYNTYRDERGIPTAAEIAALRKRYGLSLREFSLFLGFGEQTIAKYEKGTLPDTVHANCLKQAALPDGAAFLLDQNRAAITDDSAAKVESFIREARSATPSLAYAFCQIDPESAPAPSRFNGYRAYDAERVAALVCALATRCSDLFVTKLQKALFFSDFLACERLGRSLTGLQYAHADFGPIMHNYDLVLAKLVHDGTIAKQEKGNGEIISAIRRNDAVFTADELSLIDEVAQFINSFSYATQLSEYSHTLESWRETPSGRPIAYNAKIGEIEDAIAARMKRAPAVKSCPA